MRTCCAILLTMICATVYAQSNGDTNEPSRAAVDAGSAQAPPAAAAGAPGPLPECPRLDHVDPSIEAALQAYCQAVLVAHRAAVHAAVQAAAAAVERDVQPDLAAARAEADAARAAHRSCTIEGAILGAAVSAAAMLLHAQAP